MIGLQKLYDPSFTYSNGSIATVPFAMRIDSQDGRVGWVKAFDIKERNQDYDNVTMKITEDQIGWFILIEQRIAFVFRIDEVGTILQIISFGTMDLHFAVTYARLLPISNSEFLFSQGLDEDQGNFTSSQITQASFSIARIGVNLDVKYNIMIDYT